MEVIESAIKPYRNIHGGVHVPHFKNTAECATVKMPAPKQVTIAMQQHIGVPCKPAVKKGDTVYVGTVVGECVHFVSAPIHSSVSGTVSAITSIVLPSGQNCEAVVIDSDGEMTPDPNLAPFPVETPEDLVAAAKNSGLVGLGGAGFPAYIKLTKKPETPIDTWVINGAECEPFITADYRECVEHAQDVLDGIYLIKKVLDIKNVIIGVEENKPKALDILLEIASQRNDPEDQVKVMRLKSQYPQGAEKVLIYTATGRQLPIGKLPADIGCIVMNVTSVAFLNRFIRTGMPLVSKRLTVDGDCVAEPKNVRVPIGTPVSEVLEFCGGLTQEPYKLLYGGPMMGITILDRNAPVLKQNNAILALSQKLSDEKPAAPCIRCGRCIKACPMQLMPTEIDVAYHANRLDLMEEHGASYCMECGSCAYSCPSHRPLTQLMRLAKAAVRNNQKKG